MPALEDNGLSFLYCERGSEVTEEDFNNWCDTENIPPRLALPGTSLATRYRATDGKLPSWITMFSTTNLGVYEGDEYKAVMANQTANDISVMSRLVTLSRNMYIRFATVLNPDIDAAAALPAKFILVVGVAPAPDKLEEVNKWYEEEHLRAMSMVPGFVRARRYKLNSSVEFAGNADVNAPIVAFPYLTLYDRESDKYTAEPAFKNAMSTPWAVKVLSELPSSEVRPFALHKSFWKQTD